MKPLFKKDHVYGHIVKFLYANADKEYYFEALKDKFKDVNASYLNKQLKYLEKDKLIIKEIDLSNKTDEQLNVIKENIQVDRYRISHKGFLFICNLENSNRANLQSRVAIWLSIIALLITLGGAIIELKKSKNEQPISVEIHNENSIAPSDTFKIHLNKVNKTLIQRTRPLVLP